MINSEDKRLLKLIGITYNQIESGVYAVILQEEGGSRRIPIIIGFPEAQAIECKLQEIVTPRPLTHDLMVNMMSTFGISLREVNIHKLPTGVFAAELVLSADGIKHLVDSRSSDAIALAIRVGAPIYTSAQVLDEVGFIPGDKSDTRKSRPQSSPAPGRQKSVSFTADMNLRTIDSLRKEMQEASDNEDYETAARIKEEISRRERESNDNDSGNPTPDPDPNNDPA